MSESKVGYRPFRNYKVILPISTVYSYFYILLINLVFNGISNDTFKETTQKTMSVVVRCYFVKINIGLLKVACTSKKKSMRFPKFRYKENWSKVTNINFTPVNGLHKNPKNNNILTRRRLF